MTMGTSFRKGPERSEPVCCRGTTRLSSGLAPLHTRSVSRGRVVTPKQNWLRGQPALVVFLNCWTAQSSVMAEMHPADATERCGGVMLGVRRMGNESRG